MTIATYLRVFIEMFDIFAVKPADIYTFKKSFYYSNVYTKISTLIVAMLVIGYFIFLLINVISHGNPNLSFYETYTTDPKLINFGENNYFTAFGIENLDGSIISDSTLFQIEMNIFDKTVKKENIELENCSNIQNKSDSFKKFLSDIKTPENFFCLKDYRKFQLKGTWDSPNFYNIEVLLKPCNQTDGISQCKSDDDINNFLKNANFIMKYKTSSIDPFNYDQPITERVGDYFQPLNDKEYTQMYIYFAPLLVSNKPTSNFDQIDLESKTGILLLTEKYSAKDRSNTDYFFSINMRLDSIGKNFYRTYQGWTDVLANLGGFFSCLKLIFNLILVRYVRAALMQRVSNEIFDYQQIIEQIQIEGNLDKSPLEKEKTQTKFKIKMSFWQYIKSFMMCCMCYKKRKAPNEAVIIKQALRQMKKDYDISGLLNRIIETEKVQFVLPDNEYNMLKSITKPKLRLTSKPTEYSGERKFFKSFYYTNEIVRNSLKLDDGKKTSDKNFNEAIQTKSIELIDNKLIKMQPLDNDLNRNEETLNIKENVENIRVEKKNTQFKKEKHISFANNKGIEPKKFNENSENIEIKENFEKIDNNKPALKMEDMNIAEENPAVENSSDNFSNAHKNQKEINELKTDLSYFYYFDKSNV